MAAKGRLLIGVDLNVSEIYAVGMRGNWTNAQVVCAGSAPMPAGALEGGNIVNSAAVAETLKRLLERMGVGPHEAVLGIAGRGVITRVLDVPSMPDNEMGAVIQGELAHYQILRDNTGAFDFMRLQRPEELADASPQVLVMAAEEMIVGGYRAVAEQAQVRLLALEPVLLAMYRVAFAKVQAEPAALCLAINNGEVEITVVSHGQIRLYRRVDMGRSSLIVEPQAGQRGARTENKPAARSLLGEEIEEAGPESEGRPTETARQINVASASSLVIEIQRSLDYYSSQYPQSSAVSRAVMVTNDPALTPLANWLSQALSIETTVAELSGAAEAAPEAAAQLQGPEGLRYLGAIGLAMHGLAGQPVAVPRFNLLRGVRAPRVIQLGKRSLAVSLALSVLCLLIGGIVAFAMNRKAGMVAISLQQRQAELSTKQKLKQEYLDQLQAQTEQLQTLQPKGFPFPRIMDAVSHAIAPDVGLTGVSLDMSGQVLVTGEAANEKAVIRTLEGLKSSPSFENTSLDTFDTKGNVTGRPPVVRFQISLHYVSQERPQAAAPGTR
ncbi:MAG TPA: pilus assembly protein PilM [Chthonomonadaceae bacterium]|nr:pilus assembly protein PilM [Chthonomonadaceae bacterium]